MSNFFIRFLKQKKKKEDRNRGTSNIWFIEINGTKPRPLSCGMLSIGRVHQSHVMHNKTRFIKNNSSIFGRMLFGF